MRPTASIVVPMYNEAENARTTLAEIARVLEERGWTFELIPVNDGSVDGTAAELRAAASSDPRIKPVIYQVNRGRGYALRQGFAAATGDYVASLDADLSYSADHLVRMIDVLIDDPEADIVLGSQNMKGGRLEGVPFIRAAFSVVGNIVLRAALPRRIHTSTSVLRAYRRDVLRSLDLESDGKEIHLEILSDAIALGYRIIEIPAVLKARTKGHSKFRPRATVTSHLIFSILARPAGLFGVFGALLLALGALDAVYLFATYLGGGLNPERPLMMVMVLLILGGAGALAFAVVSSQLLELRRTIVRLQAEVARARHAADDDA